MTETPTGGSGPGFTQKFIYDRWGNRKIDTAVTSNVGGGVTDMDFTVLTANNRLIAPGDTTGDDTSSDHMRYDKAGNLVYDNYSAAVGQRGTMTYDAENRMLTAVNGNHQYRYEADGKRTRRLVSGQPEMWLVYGINGELVAEYDASFPNGTLKKEYGYRGGQMLIVYDSTLVGDEQLKWMVTDHLGSTRMLVNRSGNLSGIHRRDYLPFGEELASSIGHRNASGAGYVGGNNPRQKFGSKERDMETGFDYFVARHYSSVQGRFTSLDPLWIDARRLVDPQRLNLYSYVKNNPIKFIDPDGMDLYLASATEEEAKKKFKIYQKGFKPEDRSHVHLVVGNGKNGYQKGQFVVTIDKGYKSESENFQTAQQIANNKRDHSLLLVGGPKDKFSVFVANEVNGKPQLVDLKKSSGSDMYMSAKEGFYGYTFFPARKGNLIAGDFYSKSKMTVIAVANDTSDEEISATMHHESRHVVLGDFGRNIPNSKHSKINGGPENAVDRATDRADAETKSNFKKP